MLKRMNFSDKCIHWIGNCLSSTSISVLVNGSPTSEFRPQKGIRQGDPLAPFLFLIVAEGLTGLVKNAVRMNKLVGYSIGRSESVQVSILQFADDTLLIGEASVQNVMTMKAILRCFELVSGLKVNFAKSGCVGIGAAESQINLFASILHCKIQNTPVKYLGIPIGGGLSQQEPWRPI